MKDKPEILEKEIRRCKGGSDTVVEAGGGAASVSDGLDGEKRSVEMAARATTAPVVKGRWRMPEREAIKTKILVRPFSC